MVVKHAKDLQLAEIAGKSLNPRCGKKNLLLLENKHLWSLLPLVTAVWLINKINMAVQP